MTFLEKAGALRPKLTEQIRYPVMGLDRKYRRSGEYFTLDFGTHCVGYLHIAVSLSEIQDSPLQIRFQFAEMPFELDDFTYSGSLSSTWLQTETLTIDAALEEIVLPRRFAFRYVKISYPGNTAYRVRCEKAYCTAVTSADESRVLPLPPGTEPLLARIDETALRTLRDCMQLVFEDGPKRDRRLWLGDLYLQAKTNFYTYGNIDLVKRCLYLFAGLPYSNGGLSSAVYHEPVLKSQSWELHDYALFFVGVLYDYYHFTQDISFVEELWPAAYRQTQIAVEAAGERGLMQPRFYFIDWCAELDKTAAAQGTAIAMLKQAAELAGILKRSEEARILRTQVARLSEAALRLYDAGLGLFVSGPERQISWASQIWMILAGVLDTDENVRILERIASYEDAVPTVTPYAMHFYIQALIDSGKMQEARLKMCDYWGGMVRQGADCFWEVYIPGAPEASPYGSHRINSYCHAWSCTPAYFIRKYFIDMKG